MTQERPPQAPAGHFFTGQFPHLLLLAALLPGAWAVARPALDQGRWLGLTETAWFGIALAVPVLHQLIVAAVFRGQLCFHALSRLFGDQDLRVWGLIFFPFLIARPLTLIGLTVADAGSLPVSRFLSLFLGLLLLPPAIYTFWSVGRYFGFERALGGDHFRDRIRRMPFVRQGAFRWSNNAMYTFGFLILWAIALLGRSQTALAVALFQHAYIWVHMYCTEEPDIRLLYPSGN